MNVQRLETRFGQSHAVWLTAILLGAVGCGGPEATLQGRVTLDGAPLDHGTVSFVPTDAGQGASASIQSDGSYAARSGDQEGLAKGSYTVTVRSLGENRADPQGGPPMPGSLLTPQRYTRSATSGLTVEVEGGANSYDIELLTTPSLR